MASEQNCKQLAYDRPSDIELAQRWAKIIINSCYDRVAASPRFELYDVPRG